MKQQRRRRWFLKSSIYSWNVRLTRFKETCLLMDLRMCISQRFRGVSFTKSFASPFLRCVLSHQRRRVARPFISKTVQRAKYDDDEEEESSEPFCPVPIDQQPMHELNELQVNHCLPRRLDQRNRGFYFLTGRPFHSKSF